MAESEWSQNKRLIDFSQRPGGFRRSMVPNLPYFAVQFDYKGTPGSRRNGVQVADSSSDAGQEGYGHIIEGHDGVQGGEEGHDLDEAEKGGGKFERCVYLRSLLTLHLADDLSGETDTLQLRSSEISWSSSLEDGESQSDWTLRMTLLESPNSVERTISSIGRKC